MCRARRRGLRFCCSSAIGIRHCTDPLGQVRLIRPQITHQRPVHHDEPCAGMHAGEGGGSSSSVPLGSIKGPPPPSVLPAKQRTTRVFWRRPCERKSAADAPQPHVNTPQAQVGHVELSASTAQGHHKGAGEARRRGCDACAEQHVLAGVEPVRADTGHVASSGSACTRRQ